MVVAWTGLVERRPFIVLHVFTERVLQDRHDSELMGVRHIHSLSSWVSIEVEDTRTQIGNCMLVC